MDISETVAWQTGILANLVGCSEYMSESLLIKRSIVRDKGVSHHLSVSFILHLSLILFDFLHSLHLPLVIAVFYSFRLSPSVLFPIFIPLLSSTLFIFVSSISLVGSVVPSLSISVLIIWKLRSHLRTQL